MMINALIRGRQRAVSRAKILTAAALVALGTVGFSAAATANSSAASTPLINDLVAANRILANEGVLDAFGHVSVRHPDRPGHFLMSQSRSPSLIEASDIMEFDANGEPVVKDGRQPYLERFIHAAIYKARPTVGAVVHHHSPTVVPFSVSKTPLKPLSHIGGVLGGAVPVWDIRKGWGDATNLLVVDMDQGGDLAKVMGEGAAVLMRGHGAVVAAPEVRRLVYATLALHREAELVTTARQLGEVEYLSDGENAAMHRLLDPALPATSSNRSWEYWCDRAGIPFVKAQ